MASSKDHFSYLVLSISSEKLESIHFGSVIEIKLFSLGYRTTVGTKDIKKNQGPNLGRIDT